MESIHPTLSYVVYQFTAENCKILNFQNEIILSNIVCFGSRRNWLLGWFAGISQTITFPYFTVFWEFTTLGVEGRFNGHIRIYSTYSRSTVEKWSYLESSGKSTVQGRSRLSLAGPSSYPWFLTIDEKLSLYLFHGGKSNSVIKSMGVAKVSQLMGWDYSW